MKESLKELVVNVATVVAALGAGLLLAVTFSGGASAVETSGTLSVCVNDYTGNIVARAECSTSETQYLVEAEEVVVPASPRPTPTEVEATR